VSAAWLLALGALLLVLVGPLLVSGPYAHYLWLAEQGQQGLFWVNLQASAGCFLTGALLGAASVLLNLALARARWAYASSPRGPIDVVVRGSRVILMEREPVSRRLFLVAGGLGGLLGGLAGLPLAGEALFWWHRVPFGQVDPLFGHDVSFYVAVLPFWEGLLGRALLCLALGAVAAVLYYAVRGGQRLARGEPLPGALLGHATLLVGLALLLAAPGFLLERYRLVIEGSGLAAGAGYVDAVVRAPVLLVLFFLTVALGLYFLVHRRPAGVVRPLALLLSLPLVALVGLVLAPGAVQAWLVRPNELAVERSYIEHGLRLTGQAYGLDSVQVREYAARPTLDARELAAEQSTLDNVRLWDQRPLLDAYRQLQALRQYYTFADADVDRYVVEGRLRQVLIAAREIRPDEKARTWINLHLKYTHGYGVAASPVNECTAEGQPVLWIKDLPPQSSVGFRLDQPAIYFGEETTWPVLVHTAEEELDYPRGDTNVYTHYQGSGGVPLGGWWRRWMLAAYFADPNILLSRALTPGTRVMWDRDLRSRLGRLVPFLVMDEDPYPVVAGGRIYWIVDLYTVTGRYPYSRRHGGLNYLRNSVKAVVDAYEGKVRLVVADPDDPLLATWRRIYPGLFSPAEALDPEIRSHFRYPLTLFAIQSEIYKLYHMTDAQLFYNKEDVWETAREMYEGEKRPIDPYYVVLSLERGRPEFLLMLPFTPSGKDNMVAWLAARCDPPGYGQLVLYRFPKDRLVYGPGQVGGRINQDPVISQQFSLWDQRGSRVIRGFLQAIPLSGGSLLYVQPIYLQGAGTAIPELKRVVVAEGERVAMERDLPTALAALVAGRAAALPAAPPAPPPAALSPEPQGERPRARQALEHFRRAEEALYRGDWESYGQEMARAREILLRLAEGE
jgi:uncharacterized membrane protein (UPF0182 family)